MSNQNIALALEISLNALIHAKEVLGLVQTARGEGRDLTNEEVDSIQVHTNAAIMKLTAEIERQLREEASKTPAPLTDDTGHENQ